MTEFEAKKEVYFWSKDRAGGFMTLLINAISKADAENFHKLSAVYPELCYSVYCYKNKSDYYEDLCFDVERELGILPPEKLVKKSIDLMNEC